MYLLRFLFVMGSIAVADVAYVHYFLNVTARRPVRAGLWSAVVLGLYAGSTINYVGDPTLLVAAMLGAVLGTTLTVKYAR